MALLSEGKRKKFFKQLGFNEYNHETITKFQKMYFTRESDIDGVYGKDTDTLLRHVINVKDCTINFKPEEFKCPCGKCNGYPVRMRAITLRLIQAIRNIYNKPLHVTSGIRCKIENANCGGVKNSKHLSGQAVDYYIKGITDSVTGRKKHINRIKNLKNHGYSYGNGYDSEGFTRISRSMGNAIHTETK